MKLVTFTHPETKDVPRFGVLVEDVVVDPFAIRVGELVSTGVDGSEAASRAAAEVPRDMVSYFEAGSAGTGRVLDALESQLRAKDAGNALVGALGEQSSYSAAEVRLLAPVQRPRRIRDYLTYEAHATGAGLTVPPAFAQMPICYKCNVDTVVGPDDPILWPSYTQQLDYELEVGFFVAREGRNLSVAEAATAIAGVTYFNDVSARDIQLLEMSLGIGPSKGKDFCSPMGPYVVTMDELDEDNIELTARVNGEVWSHGTTANRRYSFAEVLAWASFNETVYPGEFLAIGTVGGGCGYEIDRWIQPGDLVEFDSPQLGLLRNRVGQPETVPEGAGLPSFTGAPYIQSPAH